MAESWVRTLHPAPTEKYVCDGCGEAFEGEVALAMSGALAHGEPLNFCSWACAAERCREREDDRLANVEGPPLMVEAARLYSVS